MFGYVTPLICELKVKEHNIYKSIYCGLCRTIKKNFSNLTTIFLSYDLVFFSIFAISFFNDKIEFEKKFCPLHPFKKKICLKQCSALNTAADLTILFSYFKLMDQLHDEKTIKKLASKLILVFMKKHFKKAASNQTDLTKIIQNFIKEQTQIENKNQPSSLDAACHPTANCLGLIFEKLTQNKNETEILKQFGYLLGRFIYLIDALDDLECDFKLKNFNPFLNSEQTEKLNQLNEFDEKTKNQLFQKAFHSINLTLGQLSNSYSFVKLKNNSISLKPILDNIILLGLMANHRRVFEKHKKTELFKLLHNKNKQKS